MSSRVRLAAAFLFLAASFSGCGSAAPSTTDGSAIGDGATAGNDAGNDNTGNPNSAGTCITTSGGAVGACTEYGEGYTASVIMMGCAGSGLAYSTGECPTANRVGHCDITAVISGRTTTESVSFYPPAMTATAMQQCMDENGGNGMTAVFTAD